MSGISQTELGNTIGVHLNTIGNHERGTFKLSEPQSAKTLNALIDFFKSKFSKSVIKKFYDTTIQTQQDRTNRG